MFPRKRLLLCTAFVVALLRGGGSGVRVVNAHPEPNLDVPAHELAKRAHLANKRHVAARSCANAINAFHTSRRLLRKRSAILPGLEQILLDDDELRESTCVSTPILEEGPYYVNNELVRTDLIEDQEGVVLTLDIGVVDIATCEPVPNAFIEIWSANATGYYGGFETKHSGGPPPGRRPGDEPKRPEEPGNGEPPRDRRPPPPPPHGPPERPPDGPHHHHHPPPGPPGPLFDVDGPRPDRPPPPPGPPRDPPPGPPSRPGGPGRPGGGPRGSPSMSANSTWLRGGYPTSQDGLISLTTLYPGFYPGRTLHIHLMVHTSYETSPNGTLVSHSGKLRHVGQVFFPEEWNDHVLGRAPYTLNDARRTKNSEDGIFRRAGGDRSSAIVELEMLGESLDDGLLGFITIGIDTSAEYSIHSDNYYNGSSSSE